MVAEARDCEVTKLMSTDAHNRAYFPLFVRLDGVPCLVVGGGQVACRKAQALAEAGASVTMVAPEIQRPVPGVRTLSRDFCSKDIQNAVIVIAATDNNELNSFVAELAKSQGKWVNVADAPETGNVLFAAVVRRGLLSLAVSTTGASPALARHIREQLEQQFGPEFQDLADLLCQLRREWEPKAIAAGLSSSERGAAWHAVIRSPLLDLIRQGKQSEAKKLAESVLESFLINQSL